MSRGHFHVCSYNLAIFQCNFCTGTQILQLRKGAKLKTVLSLSAEENEALYEEAKNHRKIKVPTTATEIKTEGLKKKISEQ